MIGLDTNVLVRYIAQDDKAQSARATALIEKECSASAPGYVGLVVLALTACREPWPLDRFTAFVSRSVAPLLRPPSL